jgi:hypothetical protein
MRAGDDSPNFLKAAFFNVYNLSLLGGAGLAALATQDWLVGVGALALEALWLVVGPDLKPFQRAVKRAAREADEQAEQARVEGLLGGLSGRDFQRAKARNHTDAALVELAKKNAQVLEKRLTAVRDIRVFLQHARGQMNLIENSVRLLRDQGLTMTSPNQLTAQLDGLLTSVDAVAQSVRDADALFATPFEPVAPVAGGEAPGGADKARVR